MRLQQALENQLAALTPPLAAPVKVRATAGREQAVVELVELDRLGASVHRVTVASPALATVELESLRRLGDHLAQQLCYLLEPLRVIECDPEGRTVQMRSAQPHRQGQDRYFYELWLRRGGELELLRWHTEPAAGIKEQVPMQLTREILLRLVGDFEQAIRLVEQESG